MLLVSGKNSSTLTAEMVSESFSQLIEVIQKETDASFLSSLYRCFGDCVRVVGGPDVLAAEFREGILYCTRSQLQSIADKRKARAMKLSSSQNGDGTGIDGDVDDEVEDMQLLEELEDYALDDISKLLKYFNVNHPLLIAVSSVSDLGIRAKGGWGGGDDSDVSH